MSREEAHNKAIEYFASVLSDDSTSREEKYQAARELLWLLPNTEEK